MLSLLLSLPALAAEPADADRFVVRPTGWLRPSFVYLQDADELVTDQDGFELEARLGAQAAFADWLTARVELELAPEPSLKDAAAVIAPLPWLRAELGQFKLPGSVHYLASDTRRLLPQSPQVAGEVDTRDLGAALTLALPGKEGALAAFTSGVFNGEGANKAQNVNQRYLFAQRLLVTPFGARPSVFEGTDGELYLGVGGVWLYNYQGDDLTAEESNTYGGDLQLAWGPLSAQGEFLAGDHAFANPSVANYAWRGWYGQVASFVPAPWVRDHVELVARVGQHDPDLDAEGAVGSPTAPSALEVSGGLNLYARAGAVPLHDLKLQVGYTHLEELEGASVGNDSLAVAATARF